nr:PREDICTED: uncharacterized protein LOC106492787 [Apteryx mantelli mantelli]
MGADGLEASAAGKQQLRFRIGFRGGGGRCVWEKPSDGSSLLLTTLSPSGLNLHWRKVTTSENHKSHLRVGTKRWEQPCSEPEDIPRRQPEAIPPGTAHLPPQLTFACSYQACNLGLMELGLLFLFGLTITSTAGGRCHMGYLTTEAVLEAKGLQARFKVLSSLRFGALVWMHMTNSVCSFAGECKTEEALKDCGMRPVSTLQLFALSHEKVRKLVCGLTSLAESERCEPPSSSLTLASLEQGQVLESQTSDRLGSYS